MVRGDQALAPPTLGAHGMALRIHSDEPGCSRPRGSVAQLGSTLVRSGSRLAVGLALLVLGVVSACTKGEPARDVYEVRLISIDGHGGPAVDEDRVRAIFRRSLDAVPSFEVAERDQRSGHRVHTLAARLEYRELPDSRRDDSEQGRDLLVRLVVETPAELDAELGEEGLDVTVLLERSADEVELGEDLQLAADRLAAIIQARTDLARRTPGAVGRLLESADPELLVMTLEWIREHADAEEARVAADRVAELINQDDERVGLLAIEVIGAIGGPEHVAPLLERIRLTDPGQVYRTYDALAQLGGPEAIAFLEFAARNEDVPESRRAAEQALARIASGQTEVATSDRAPAGRATLTRGHR